MPGAGAPTFFATPAKFGAWLAKNAGKRDSLVVGFWKVGTGKPSMTWAESVEQALIHGWIDGKRKSLGDEAYCIRFSPRKPGSHWSTINMATARRLKAEGRLTPAGSAAFAARRADRTARASYEQRKSAKLGGADLRRFKSDALAWAWFAAARPSYQRACTWWIQEAKKPETRRRRLELVVAHARKGEVVPAYGWSKQTPDAESVNSN